MATAVSSKIRIAINGVKQSTFLEGASTANPVLLFVHGGPGMPEYWLTQRYPIGLENHFTPCGGSGGVRDCHLIRVSPLGDFVVGLWRWGRRRTSSRQHRRD